MPELPDITVYTEALETRLRGAVLERIAIANPFVLRSVDPPLKELEGRAVIGIRRLGKQIVLCLDGEFFAVLHLMVAGRLQWKLGRLALLSGKTAIAAFEFTAGTLVLTEAGSKKRASLHAVRGEAALAAFDRQALEVLTCSLADFAAALQRARPRRPCHDACDAARAPRLCSPGRVFGARPRRRTATRGAGVSLR